MLLHTHSVMAFILALTGAGMFMHLFRLREPVRAKGWLMAFYFSLFMWQIADAVRNSMPPGFMGSLGYKITVAFVLIPFLSFTLIAHTQYVYRFLVDVFLQERKLVFRISAGLFLGEFAYVVWGEFFRSISEETMVLSAFLFSSFFTLWMISLALRKAAYMRGTNRQVADAHYFYAAINGCYVIGSTISVIVGFYTVTGSWSYFMFVWFGNLASIVMYIQTAAVPASFQTKITGFTYVVAASILCIITLSFYPPDFSGNTAALQAQQEGLKRLVIVIVLVALLIVLLLPLMLKVSLTKPLHRLLQGVQAVNEGKLDTQVEVGLMDEIGLLSQNFNQMTRNLKRAREELTAYTHTLEEKVAMRTAELQQSLEELKTAQAQLIQSEKMASLGELTAGIAHEIKNPLNFIVNFSEVGEDLTTELKEELSKATPDKESIQLLIDDLAGNFQKMANHGKRASNIVTSMLEHSRASNGVKEPTDINELIELYLRASYDEMQIKNKGFHATIKKQFDPDVGKLNIMPQDIGRVLLNLFSNAFYAVNEKKNQLNGTYEPTIWVRTEKEGNQAFLYIKDNGTGISPKLVDKIFQPFFTTKPAGQGTGLGLSLSYDIVRAHGGKLNVYTTGEEGAEFFVQLPLS